MTAPSDARADVHLQIETEQVAVAEPVSVTLQSDGGAVVWPDWSTALPGWEVVPESVTDTQARLTLRSWLPGDIAIPMLTATTPGGVTFTTEARTVTVISVLPDDADVSDYALLRDGAGLLPGADRGTRFFGWPAAGLAALIIIAFAVFCRLRYRRSISPEVQADERLTAAEASDDVGEAVDAVRIYVEKRFGHRVQHQTATELARDDDAGTAMSVPLRDELSALQKRGEQARFSNRADRDASKVIAHARRVFGHAQTVAKERPTEVKR